jgi:hypothetical protein
MKSPKKKMIPVRCKGGELLPLKELLPLQGSLKTLSKENRAKLVRSIERHGIAFPLFYWESEGKKFTVDGHARAAVLGEMVSDGYEIEGGLVPCDRIEARTESEAKELVLLASSRYGKVDDGAFFAFIDQAGLDISLLADEVDIPEISLKAAASYDFSDLEEESKQLDGNEDAKVELIVPAKYAEHVRTYLAGEEPRTPRGLGREALRKCGLL